MGKDFGESPALITVTSYTAIKSEWRRSRKDNTNLTCTVTEQKWRINKYLRYRQYACLYQAEVALTEIVHH